MGYISILAVAVIIAFMAYFGWRGNFQPPGEVSKNTKSALTEQGMNASTYQDVLSSVRTRLNESSQVEADRLKGMENFK